MTHLPMTVATVHQDENLVHPSPLFMSLARAVAVGVSTPVTQLAYCTNAPVHSTGRDVR